MKKCHAGYPVIADYLLIGLLIAGAFTLYEVSADSIPVHYNFTGEADIYGNPAVLFFIPVFSIGLYLLLKWVKRFPGSFNYPVKLNENNQARQQQLALALLDVYGMLTLIAFNLLQLHLVFNALTASHRLIWIWGPVILISYLAPVPVYLRKAYHSA